MAITKRTAAKRASRTTAIERFTQTSGANSAQTCSTDSGIVRRLVMVTVRLSANGTVTATVTLNNGEGTGYDTQIGSIAISAGQHGVFIPASDVFISDNDSVDVDVPAAGVATTSSVSIYTEV